MKPIRILAISFLLVIGLGISVVGASTLPSQVSSAGTFAMPYADSTPNPQKTKIPEGETPDGNQVANAGIAQAIAKYLGVTEAEVDALHDSGKGFGEIVKAYVLAQASGKSVDDIFASRARTGLGRNTQVACGCQVEHVAWQNHAERFAEQAICHRECARQQRRPPEQRERQR